MSAVESVGPFRLGERVGTSVWKAEDTRTGKTVALKLLTKQLPKDQAKRDALIRDVRQAAALYHAFIVPIQEITVVGDNLLMVMDLLNARAVTKKVAGAPVERSAFFRTSYQVAEALRFLHGKGVVHMNVNGDSVLVTPEGQVRLGGFNLLNLQGRRDGSGPSAYQQKGNDIRSVPYMAPEQITGQEVDPRTDLFSLGSIMYEMGTGKPAFPGANATEAARKVVEGQPASPKSLNPAIDAAVMNAIGACLFKDIYKRPKDARALVDLLAKLDPDASKFAGDLASAKVMTAAAAAGEGPARQALLFIADIANYGALAAKDAGGAAKAASRMQQILGESVYLYDGQVVDPFGPRMVAELPTVESAIEAAKKGEFDFSPEQQEGEPVPVRMLLHAGSVRTKEGHVVGESIDQAAKILAQIPPLKLLVTEAFAREAKGKVKMKDGGAVGTAKVFSLVPTEAPQPAGPTPEEIAEREAAEAAAAAAAEAARRKKRKLLTIMVPALLAVLIGVAVVFLRSDKEPSTQVTAAPAASAPVQVTVLKVAIEAITVEGTDRALPERAKAVRLASMELLRNVPKLALIDGGDPAARRFSALLRTGPSGPEIVPVMRGTPDENGPAAPAPDASSAVQSLVQWVASRVGAPPPAMPATPEALNALAEALAAADTDPAKADATMRTAMKADPNFLPAQLAAMRYFATRSDPDAVAAARQVFALDPRNLDAARRIAIAAIRSGSPGAALAAYNAILRVDTNNEEALVTIARYAASVRDTQHFGAALKRLQFLPPQQVPVHEPDLLLTNGRLDAAVDRYYNIEVEVPNNPHLALKIGRIAILRRTMPIAELELEKLRTLDPSYGYRLLKAYLAAQRGSIAEAQIDLKAAEAAAKPVDDFWTAAAEVYAIVADSEMVIASLEKALANSEPVAGYVGIDPLFEYLESDARFQAIRDRFAAQQQEIRAALAQITL